MGTTQQNKQTVHTLITSNRLDYSSVINREDLLKIFDIKPLQNHEIADLTADEVRKRVTEDALQELTVTDLIRTELLKLGRYFEKSNDNYRVCSPAENKEKVAKYMAASQRKARRASILLANTPPNLMPVDNSGGRALIAEQTANRHLKP